MTGSDLDMMHVRGSTCVLKGLVKLGRILTSVITLTHAYTGRRYRRKIQPILCAVKMTEDRTALTGTVSGHLYVWKVHPQCRETNARI